MITLSIAGILISFVLIALLLLSLNLYSNFPWFVKAGAIMLVSCFYLICYFSFPPLLGWPTTSSPIPERFRLISAHIEEPNKIAGTEGAIYLWLTDMTSSSNTDKPRAYSVGFSNELHKKVTAAKLKLGKKLPQLGQLNEDETKTDEVKDNSQGGQVSRQIEFYDMPDPLFPEK